MNLLEWAELPNAQTQWEAALSHWGGRLDVLGLMEREGLGPRAERALAAMAASARLSEASPPARASALGAALFVCAADALGHARGHARVASGLWPLLDDVGWDSPQQWQVTSSLSALQDAHHRVHANAPGRAYLDLARRVDVGTLLALAEVHQQGVLPRQVWPEMLELELQEAGLWGQGAALGAFARHIDAAMAALPAHVREWVIREGHWALGRGQVHTPQEALARGWRAREGLAQAWVQCGLSGSGKTTWVEHNLPQAHLVCMDTLRAQLTSDPADQGRNAQVFALAREHFKRALRAREPVVWSSTNLRRSQRAALLETARAYGAHTTLVVHHVGLGCALARNARRARQVPADVIRRQAHTAQLPLEDEAHRVMWIGRDGQCWRDTRAQPWCLGER